MESLGAVFGKVWIKGFKEVEGYSTVAIDNVKIKDEGILNRRSSYKRLIEKSYLSLGGTSKRGGKAKGQSFSVAN